MRKITKIVSLACLAVSLFFVAPSAQASAATSDRGGDGGEMMTICYYGVTLKVSQKIGERYMKLGATRGGCGEQGPIRVRLCSLGEVPSPGPDGCVNWVAAIIGKPASSEKAIQLNLSNDEAAKGLLSLDARVVASR